MKKGTIKIFYLIESLKTGGAEQMLLTTLKYLDLEKFRPIVCCIQDKGEIGREIEEGGINVISLNLKTKLFNWRAVFDLIKLLRKESPDILQTHLFYANYFGRVAAIFARVPIVIITEHGTYSNFKKIYHYAIDFILSFVTDTIIVVSNAVKNYIMRHEFIPKGKIKVIYNAIDSVRFDKNEKDRKSARLKLGFRDSDFIIGNISNFAPWKGQLIFVQAFKKVSQFFPSAKICIVGRDWRNSRSKLERYAEENNILDKVIFLDVRRDIPDLLRAFDIFAFPSLTEGLGISVLEAMYMRLPIIASKVEGILEVIENEKDGLLVSPGNPEELADGIMRLLKDSNKAKELGLSAREKVSRYFSPYRYINNLQSFYVDLVNKESEIPLT